MCVNLAQETSHLSSFVSQGLRLDGIPALDLWDLIVAVHGNTYQSNQGRGDFLHEPGSFNTSHNSKTKEISWNDR